MSETIIPATVAQRYYRRARNVGGVSEDVPAGWSTIISGPEKLLAVFKPLKLKRGFTLVGYQFREGGNGNGFIYAVPEGSRLPFPDDCPTDPDHFLGPPVPPTALEDVMDAIEGDGSPVSYLCASLLNRELEEFGAMWHGCSWGTHELVTKDPFARGGCLRPQSKATDRAGLQIDFEKWQWHKPKPARWEPRVKLAGGNVTVIFHTYSGLERDAIYRHVDRYKTGAYRFKARRVVVAEGPSGYIF